MAHADGQIGAEGEVARDDVAAGGPPRPDLPGDVVVQPTADELIDCLAADLVVHAENCVRQFGDFHLALSGDAVLEPLYRRLMYDPNYRRIPWRRAHLWFVEERCVPFTDHRSSFHLISGIIGEHADIPREQFHPIFAEAATAASDYQDEIREALAWREKGHDRLDYVLLTMDAEGRTTGVTAAEPPRGGAMPIVLRAASRDGAAPERVGLTIPFINGARFIALFAAGAPLAAAVGRLAAGNGVTMPVRGVAPINGELRWYLDEPAAGGSG